VSVLVEGCVDSLESSLAAVQGGARRLELCDDLSVGGITPSVELLDAVTRTVNVPVFVMIRPRGGPFEYSKAELDQMRRDIQVAKEHGADGLVIGVLDQSQNVDLESTRELVRLAGDSPVTFHRAFDVVGDQPTALEALIDAGVARVLTGGGPGKAEDGIPMLARLVEQAGERIVLLAGGGVRAHNARELVRRTGVREVHARCERDPARIATIIDALHF